MNKIIVDISDLDLPYQIEVRKLLIEYKPKFISSTTFIVDKSDNLVKILDNYNIFSYEKYK